MTPRSIDYANFERRTRKYHDYTSVCTALTYHHVYSRLHFTRSLDPFSKQGLALAIDAYVKHWGNMTRVLGSKSRLEGPIYKVLQDYRAEMGRFERGMPWAGQTDFEPISELFDEIANVRFISKGKRKRFGPTSAGKLLHIVYPNTCIMWDKENVRDPWKLGEDGESYVWYIRRKWQEFGSILDEFSRAHSSDENPQSMILNSHASYLNSIGFEGITEPLTKLLDEANYP